MTQQAAGPPGAPRRTGEVFDLGFQRYEGPREGRRRARRAIWKDGVRASLALGRSAAQKALPFGIIAIALIPALVIVAVIGFLASFGPVGAAATASEELSNRGYYDFAFFPLLLFAATLSPELLSPDRRSNVLVLYLVRPITPIDYVLSRWMAFLSVSLGVLWAPQLLIYVTRLLNAASIQDFVRDEWDVIFRAAAAGAVIAAFLTTVGLAIASLTDRRAYAAAGVLGFLLLTAAVGGIGEEVLTGAAAEWVGLLNLGGAVLHVNDLIFGTVDLGDSWRQVAVVAGVIVAGWAVLWSRYRKLSV